MRFCIINNVECDNATLNGFCILTACNFYELSKAINRSEKEKMEREKAAKEAEDEQNCMNCAHLKKEKGRPVWNCELMEKARATDEDGEFFCEDYEAL